MMRLLRSLLLALAFIAAAAPPALAARDAGDLICETTTTTGTGTLSLAGAYTSPTVYVGFASQIASGSDVTYTIVASDGKIETGDGVFTDGSPDTLTRVASWSSDGSGAELTLPAGTHIVCNQWNTVVVAAQDLQAFDDVIVGGDVLVTGSVEVSGNASATLSTSGANLLVEGSIAERVGRNLLVVLAPDWNPTITNGAARDYSELATNDIISDSLKFDTTTQQFATFYWVPPQRWNAGTVTFRVRWRSTIGTASDTLEMELSCVAISNDDALDAAPGTAQATNDTWIANGDEHISPESSAITCAGSPAKGDTVAFKLTRDVATDNVDDAFIEAVEIFWTSDAANDS